MRNETKVVIGFGAIWGLYAFCAVIIGSFTIGTNDTTPEVVALVLYGLTLLPSCILAIWRRRVAATWLITLAFLTVGGFAYQDVHQAARGELGWSLAGNVIQTVIFAAIPGVIGMLLLRGDRRESLEPDVSVPDWKRDR